MLYSLADGATDTWVQRQLIRFGIGLVVMFAIALTDIRVWLSLSYYAFFGALALLIGVELIGISGMGATRWVDIGLVTLQPSELMKIAMVLALGKFKSTVELDDLSEMKN